MASSQGDVRSSPMAHPAVRPLPKLARYLYGQTRALPLKFDYVFGQNVTELRCSCAIALRSPAPERSSDLKRYSPDIHYRRG